jgi:hypothetical protein
MANHVHGQIGQADKTPGNRVAAIVRNAVRAPRFDRDGREWKYDLYLASHRTAWLIANRNGKVFPETGEAVVVIDGRIYLATFEDGAATDVRLVGATEAPAAIEVDGIEASVPAGVTAPRGRVLPPIAGMLSGVTGTTVTAFVLPSWLVDDLTVVSIAIGAASIGVAIGLMIIRGLRA